MGFGCAPLSVVFVLKVEQLVNPYPEILAYPRVCFVPPGRALQADVCDRLFVYSGSFRQLARTGVRFSHDLIKSVSQSHGVPSFLFSIVLLLPNILGCSVSSAMIPNHTVLSVH